MISCDAAQSRRRGFTLIEVLVVVAIIALLFAILLPSLSKARETARGVKCQTHLSQIFKGVFIYTQQNGERLPNLGMNPDVGWWAAQIARPLSFQFDLYVCPSHQEPAVRYLQVRGGHARMASKGSAGAVPVSISYSGACDTLDTLVGASNIGRKITSFKRPSTSICMMEGFSVTASLANGCFRNRDLIKVAHRGWKEFDPSFLRHNGRSNMLFLDSHVERLTPEQICNQVAYQQEFYGNDSSIQR